MRGTALLLRLPTLARQRPLCRCSLPLPALLTGWGRCRFTLAGEVQAAAAAEAAPSAKLPCPGRQPHPQCCTHCAASATSTGCMQGRASFAGGRPSAGPPVPLPSSLQDPRWPVRCSSRWPVSMALVYSQIVGPAPGVVGSLDGSTDRKRPEV